MADALCSPPPSLEQYTELAETAGSFIHEIKNRLGTLSLNIQLLAEDFEQPQTQRERRAGERIARLHTECGRLLELSNDFLRFARVQELHFAPATLEEVVTRMIDFLMPTARARGIDISWYADCDLPAVRLDTELFEQALLNLMLNAEQAMPEGGTLTLIGRAGPAGCVCLDVIDTGHGIAPEVQPQLFRPFHTTKRNGNGLGLATTRKIVLAHGGGLSVQSEPGRGTKFTLTLPAHPATA